MAPGLSDCRAGAPSWLPAHCVVVPWAVSTPTGHTLSGDLVVLGVRLGVGAGSSVQLSF